MTQFALFTEAPVRPTTPSEDSVRARIAAILDELKSSKTMPWTDAGLHRREMMIPQMCKWLPEDEAKQLVAEFEVELCRLRKTAA